MGLLRNLMHCVLPTAEKPKAARPSNPSRHTARPSAVVRRSASINVQPVASGQMQALPHDYLSTLVYNQDIQPESSRLGGTEGYLHASSLVDACARRECLAIKFGEQHKIRGVIPADRIVWAMGRTAEAHVRAAFIKATNGSNVYGKWLCRCEKTFHVGMKPKLTCTSCETPVDNYTEALILDEDVKIRGNCDLPFMFGEYLVAGEIKSINKRDFETLVAPKGNHVTQVALYRDMYQRKGWKVHDKAVVIYVCKDYQTKGTPYREFQVDCTTQSVESTVNIARAEAAKVARFREDGRMPPRTVCRSATDKAARDCPMAALCFQVSG